MISPYEHGRNAAQHGKHIQACPFDCGTEEWHGWRRGYSDVLPARLPTLRRSMPNFFVLVAADFLPVTVLLAWALQCSS